MKNKIFTGILICLLFLVLPAAAADYTLGIYGNANEDSTINMQDVTYTELIILEYKDATALADAKYDGEIDILDVTQIELIILGMEKELTILDTAQRIVTIKKPVETIIVLTDDSAEAIRTLGAKDQIVAVSIEITEEKVFYPELSELQCIGKWNKPDIELILSIKPDIIFSYKSATEKYLVPHLEDTDISLVGLDFYREDIMREEFEKIGYILNKRDEAEEYIAFFSNIRDMIGDRVSEIADEEKQRVYLEGYSDYKTYVRGKGGDVACTAAGGINIAADLEGNYPEVDPEWVLEQNPDIIIRLTPPSKVPCGYDIDDPYEMIAKRNEVMARPGWDHITAVSNERVYLILYEFGCSPRVPITIAYMAKWFYPDLFDDLDPKALHQEYLTEFQGLDYNLDERGVFVYPLPE